MIEHFPLISHHCYITIQHFIQLHKVYCVFQFVEFQDIA